MENITLKRTIDFREDGEMEVEVTGGEVELRWVDDRVHRYVTIPVESFRAILDTVAAFNALTIKHGERHA